MLYVSPLYNIDYLPWKQYKKRICRHNAIVFHVLHIDLGRGEIIRVYPPLFPPLKYYVTRLKHTCRGRDKMATSVETTILHAHCPPVEWNQPTSATVSSHSWWKSTSISIGDPPPPPPPPPPPHTHTHTIHIYIYIYNTFRDHLTKFLSMVDDHFFPALVSLFSRKCWLPQLPQSSVSHLHWSHCELSLYTNYYLKPNW